MYVTSSLGQGKSVPEKPQADPYMVNFANLASSTGSMIHF